MLIEVIDLSARQLVGAFGPRVLTVTWRAGFSTAEVARLHELIRDRARKAKAPISTLIDLDIELGDRPPSSAVRDAIVNLWRDEADRIESAAIVHDSQGFVGSLVRTVTTGILMHLRAPFPAKAFASLSDGSKMVLRHTDGGAANNLVLNNEMLLMRSRLRAHAQTVPISEESMETMRPAAE